MRKHGARTPEEAAQWAATWAEQRARVVELHDELLDLPLQWRKPRRVFVNSMSDLFHPGVLQRWIEDVFTIMAATPHHAYQVLTKRAARLQELAPDLPWPANVWMGVSIESDEYTWRVDCLRATGAAVKFLSLEPLLGPLPALDLRSIDWVIAGGESGPGARPMDLDWARDIRDQCQAAGVPFFLKQLGGRQDKRGGERALLDGRLWREWPAEAGRKDE